MRKIYNIVFLLFAICFFACSDDDNEGQSGDALVLNASSNSIDLKEGNENDIAITFTWNKGLDRGQENSIVYIFRLDVDGADFKTSDPIEISPDGDFSISYTHKELNDLITKKWGYSPGDDVRLEARVVVKVSGPKFIYPEISVVEIQVKSYTLDPKPLYLIGDATLAGFKTNKGIMLTESEVGIFYHWKGSLKPGSFKFITTLDNVLPSYNKGSDDNTLVERINASDADNMFTITQEGIYAIALFRKDMKIDYKLVKFPTVYMVGNATSADWDIGKAIELQWNPANPNVFTLECTLKAGEFKMYEKKDWGSYVFRPLIADESIKNDGVQVYKDGDDLKWKVQDDEAGDYKITLDLNKMKINFEKQ